ncbi:MAG: DUF4870 domain-containing protein [Phycisphaerae bacterium]
MGSYHQPSVGRAAHLAGINEVELSGAFVATYTPTESERRATAAIQGLAGFLLFLPPLIALQTKPGRRSPYIKYWSKVCLCWSLIVTIVMITAVVCASILDFAGPGIVVATVHFVFCVTGAMSSYFNSPFRYWFVAHACCESELGEVYGQLVAPTSKTDHH